MAVFDADRTTDQLNTDYNARATVSEAQFDIEMGKYLQRTAQAREICNAQLDIPYDTASAETFDLYPVPGPPTPVVIFIHGGYWRALGREHSGFMAPMLAEQGIATIAPNYTLAPAVTLSEITRQMRACLAYVWHNHAALNIDRNRITVIGSSAGGHLTGTLITGTWHTTFDLPPNPVASAMPISGLFDLAPIARCFPQEWLNLSANDVAVLSPLQNIPKTGCPILNAYAAQEPAGFARQSDAFHSAWQQAGFHSEVLEIPNRTHFDVVLDLCDPTTALSKGLLDLIKAGETP